MTWGESNTSTTSAPVPISGRHIGADSREYCEFGRPFWPLTILQRKRDKAHVMQHHAPAPRRNRRDIGPSTSAPGSRRKPVTSATSGACSIPPKPRHRHAIGADLSDLRGDREFGRSFHGLFLHEIPKRMQTNALTLMTTAILMTLTTSMRYRGLISVPMRRRKLTTPATFRRCREVSSPHRRHSANVAM